VNLSSIPDFGTKRLAALNASGINTVWDFLWYLPREWNDLRTATKIKDLKNDVAKNDVTSALVVRIAKITLRSNVLIARIQDESGSIEIPFFEGIQYWLKTLKEGVRCVVIGKRCVNKYGVVQMSRSDIRLISETEEYVGEIEPIYTITGAMKIHKLTNKILIRGYKWLFSQNLSLKLLPDKFACPAELLSFLKIRPLTDILKRLHCPKTMEEIYVAKAEITKLELLPFCLRKAMRRRQFINSGIPRKLDCQKMDRAKEKLPFALTSGQIHVLEQIKNGLESSRQYHAILQGDVGSGKTVVALLAMIGICGGGIIQAACMVPTDILARQHFLSMEELFKSAGLRIALLVGAMGGAERREVLAGLTSGQINAVIGTHALFSKDVEFSNLGFIIIDEQHRFGVKQRETLLAKGNNPDLLVMSATPIPRSLAMTFYGDLEPLILREKPPGRIPVNTVLRGNHVRNEMKNYLYENSLAGNRCYWVVSRVQEDEFGVAASVGNIYDELKSFRNNWKIAVVHGQMPEPERDANLKAFASGEISLLVCTTVVEVGVNVPEANLMVIDKPESFGLAQLHQLRGRVGRGNIKAHCILLCEEDNAAFERLKSFSSTSDGFEIAEMDLQNRGAGNLEGSEQSGAWLLRWFDWVKNMPLIEKTISTANDILDNKANFSPEVLQKIQNWYNNEKFEKIEDGVH
jgi:ATP-dependent DNA helicase RecG